MVTQRESKRSKDIMAAIRSRGHFCFKVHGSEYMMAGLPDIIVCAQGVFIGIETKHPETRGDTSAKQDRVHGQIRMAEGYCTVATSAPEALSFIEACLLDMYGQDDDEEDEDFIPI